MYEHNTPTRICVIMRNNDEILLAHIYSFILSVAC